MGKFRTRRKNWLLILHLNEFIPKGSQLKFPHALLVPHFVRQCSGVLISVYAFCNSFFQKLFFTRQFLFCTVCVFCKLLAFREIWGLYLRVQVECFAIGSFKNHFTRQFFFCMVCDFANFLHFARMRKTVVWKGC